MKRWNDFLDSLATGGGAIFVLMFFTVISGGTALHILHHPNYSEQMITVFTGLLTGFSSALLGALTARSKPPNTTTTSTTEITSVQKPIDEPPKA